MAITDEMVERGARAVAALDWDAEHGGVDPSDEGIARAVLSAALDSCLAVRARAVRGDQREGEQ